MTIDGISRNYYGNSSSIIQDVEDQLMPVQFSDTDHDVEVEEDTDHDVEIQNDVVFEEPGRILQPSQVSFEEMKRQLGDIVIELQRYRREHHDLMLSILDQDHANATSKHAESYRTNIAIFMTALKCAVESCAVVSIATPHVFYTGGEQLSKLGINLIGRFNGDINMFSDASQKLFTSLASVTETGKQLIETRAAGDRTEVSAAEQKLKSFLDRRQQDHVQALRDEIEELRKLEEMIKRENDVISLMCR